MDSKADMLLARLDHISVYLKTEQISAQKLFRWLPFV